MANKRQAPQQKVTSTMIEPGKSGEQRNSPSKSPRFVKPADLFKMRRKKSIPMAPLTDDSHQQQLPPSATPIEPITPSKLSPLSPHRSSHIPLGSILMASNHGNQQQLTPRSPMKSPNKIASARRLFGAPGPSSANAAPSPLTQSPLKCLNNTINSPIKKLPTLLRNPFGGNQNSNSSSSSLVVRSPMKTPIKRKLSLDENRSPRKKHRMIELDEDANLEPPEPNIDQSSVAPSECYPNDWTLRTKLRINFRPKCKNWIKDKTSTHRRSSNFSKKVDVDMNNESSNKDNSDIKCTDDTTISVEAIKNVCTVYQHPYMAWMPLFPRITIDFSKTSQEVPLNLAKQPHIANSLHKDWCDSLNDLVSLLSEGLCPYFYMCTDMYNILFKHITKEEAAQNNKGNQVYAYISPCSYGLRSEFKRLGIEFVCSTDTNETTSSSQNCTALSIIEDLEEEVREETSSNVHDSGLTSGEDSNEVPDENDETSQFLESLGLSQQDFPSLKAPVKRKSMDEASKGSLNSAKNIATVAGLDNVTKMIDFLKSSRLYTMTNVGKFACVPPTLLSPVQFRRSTPQHPEVVLSKQIDETIKKPTGVKSKLFQPKESQSIANQYAPTFLEVKGTILPSVYTELHTLLDTSNNLRHSCISTTLDSSTSFKYL